MKVNWNKRYATIAVYAFLVLAATIALGLMLGGYFNPFFSTVLSVGKALLPILYGFILAFFTVPLTKRFDMLLFSLSKKKKAQSKARHIFSMVLAYLVVLLIIVGLIMLIIPQLIDSLTTLASNISDYSSRVMDLLTGFFKHMEPSTAQYLEQVVESSYSQLSAYLSGLLQRLSDFIPQIFTFTVSVFTTIINLLIGFVVSIYITYDQKHFKHQFRRVMACLFPKRFNDTVYDVAGRASRVMNAFFIGKALDSLIIGVIAFIFLLIMRMPYPLLIAGIVGITNMIPYFGPFIGAIPSALLIFLIDPLQCLWFVIFIIILQQIDGNILGPKIVGQSMGLSSFWVVFSLLLFGKLFGFVGMFIGSPVFAVLYELIGDWIRSREKKKLSKEETVPAEEPAGEKE